MRIALLLCDTFLFFLITRRKAQIAGESSRAAASQSAREILFSQSNFNFLYRFSEMNSSLEMYERTIDCFRC